MTPELFTLGAEFTRREVLDSLQAWEDAGEVPRSLHLAAAKQGLLGLGFAPEVGGEGGTLADMTALQEGMLAAGASSGLLAALFTGGIALPHLARHGSPALVDRYVRPTLAGRLIGALAVTEPGGGSDVAHLTTRAVRDGDDYVVNGTKTFITSGARADFVTVAVRTGRPEDGHGGARGISLLVIDKDTPGFSLDRRLAKMGWHCSDTAELGFSDVRVPAGNLVGEENAAFGYLAEAFVTERIALAVHAYGIAARSLALTAEHARGRSTFGEPLIARQVVRHRLVEMHRRVEAAKAYTHAVVREYDAEGTTAGTVAGAALAKHTAVEASQWVCDQAVQLHGGTGYLHGTEVERHYRDTRILPIGGGASEVMTDLAAKLLGYADSPHEDTGKLASARGPR
ncbi:acyl-CoA dehydrogenase family protein [Nocardioides sp. BP30]|uniref:acyl-CoA dehydrogenase family protein n=1 Tax=Nocardioides sp. BP30 TaxID=3036374 RepID=UPI0024684137|nr:acyl-CoA dehydrogenase family protein [Nocardioides sp. BP30]WGL52722.1 acyl-CoA dehydrogenase family protein [Nocardioides sp. BP30]